MIDKTTTSIKLKGGQWVRVGIIERAIEGDRTVVLNAVFGTEII